MKQNRRMKKFMAVVLACTLFLMTGCNSIVRNAKPPKQYEKSQVLDGNFIDFSDPEQVLALYKAHYDAMQKDNTYKSYSSFRGGTDIFGVKPEWSKNFLSFQVVNFDTKTNNLLYAYTTTYTSSADLNYGYQGSATVKFENDKPIVESTVKGEDPVRQGVIAAVGFYNAETGKTTLFYVDEDKSISTNQAGSGIYNLVVNYEYETVCVLYKNKIQFYKKNGAQYTRDGNQNYDLSALYTSVSFVNGLPKEIAPAKGDLKTGDVVTYSIYSILPLGDTVLTSEDKAALDGYLKRFDANMGYKPEKSNYVPVVGNINADMEEDVRFPGIVSLYEKAEPEVVASAKKYNIRLASDWFSMKARFGKYGASVKINNVAVPWALKFTILGSPNRTYAACIESHAMSTNQRYEKVDWKNHVFTIHNIHYLRTTDGVMIPRWLQIAHSIAKTEIPENPVVTKDNLKDILGNLESNAEADMDGSTTWLNVFLKVSAARAYKTVTVNTVQKIVSKEQLDSLVGKEKEAARQEINATAERLTQKTDWLQEIDPLFLTDLEEELNRYKQLKQEREAAEKAAKENTGETDSESSSSEKGSAGEASLEKEITTAERLAEESTTAESTAAENSAEASSEEEKSTEESDGKTSDGDQNNAVKTSDLTCKFTVRGNKEVSASYLDVCSEDELGEKLLKSLNETYKFQENLKAQTVFLKSSLELETNTYFDKLLNVMSVTYENGLKEDAGDSEAQVAAIAVDPEAQRRTKEALDRMIQKRTQALDGQFFRNDLVSIAGENRPYSKGESVGTFLQWGLEKLTPQIENDYEHNALITYLKKNHGTIAADLKQSVDDMNLLYPLAIEASNNAELVSALGMQDETIGDASRRSIAEIVLEKGFTDPLHNYKDASKAELDAYSGISNLEKERQNFRALETDQVCVSRNVADWKEKKIQISDSNYDRTKELLNALLFGSDQKERAENKKELKTLSQKISLDIQSLENEAVVSKSEEQLVISYNMFWTAEIAGISQTQQDYLVADQNSKIDLKFETVKEANKESYDRAAIEPKIETLESLDGQAKNITKEDALRAYLVKTGKISITQGEKMTLLYQNMDSYDTLSSAWKTTLDQACENKFRKIGFPDMEQVVHTTVNYSPNGQPLEVVLASKLEGTIDPETNKDVNPKFYFLNFEQSLDLDEVKDRAVVSITTGKYDTSLRSDTVQDYNTVYGGSDEQPDELSKTAAEVEQHEKELQSATTTYSVKLRGLLGENNTIFLDNPKYSKYVWQENQFYFLNISLDEGVRLYSCGYTLGDTVEKDKNGNIVVKDEAGIWGQKPFTQEFVDLYSNKKDQYLQGAYFRGWWIPDGKTPYNADGTLSGGDLILLGLSPEDMKTAEEKNAEAEKKAQEEKDAAADAKAGVTAEEAAGESVKAGEATGGGTAAETTATTASTGTSSLRKELVNDDIFHSKLYKIHITSEQMNACKVGENKGYTRQNSTNQNSTKQDNANQNGSNEDTIVPHVL